MSKGEGQLHNRLVRDKIPAYLDRLGVDYEVEIISDKERLLRMLIDKLEEEAQNVALAKEDQLVDVLADIETVVDGILTLKGISRDELTATQILKDETSGKLEKGIFLVRSVTPEDPEVEDEKKFDEITEDDEDDD